MTGKEMMNAYSAICKLESCNLTTDLKEALNKIKSYLYSWLEADFNNDD